MQRCIELAINGMGTARPNPMVGCVIVHNKKIIGEGFTSPYGGDHAEVNAIHSVKNKALLKQSTIYVSLEPCAHFGKTPPCANLIVQHQIPNVIIGCLDTNKLVSGKGVKILKQAGCNVTVGVLEDSCKTINKRFFTFHQQKRPYIFLKWAETQDGFIAPAQRSEVKPVWITNKQSRQLVHQLRSNEQAILVGTNTVLEDNPSLTTRSFFGNSPTRIILDASLKLSKKRQVFDAKAPTMIIYDINVKQPIAMSKVTCQAIDFKGNVAQQVCDVLYQNNIQSVIIEGGAKTLQTFINASLWDEAHVFVGATFFNKGVKAPQLKNAFLLQKMLILEDVLKTYSRK